MPVMTAPGRLRQEDCEFEAFLDYRARLCLKRKTVKGKQKILKYLHINTLDFL
jgi:hypothetical protein